MSEITRHPLCWPDNVARRAPQQRGVPKFEPKTLPFSIAFVLAEINRLNNRRHDDHDERVIISINVPFKKSGSGRITDGPEPKDPAAAVYFKLDFMLSGKAVERHVVLTCDRWVKVSWNLYAIGKDIEAQRGRERWGCTNLEQSFRGYLAIPERTGGPAWWDILEVKPDAGQKEIESAFNKLAKVTHPDVGGDHESWVKLKLAYDQAMARFKS